MRYFGCTAPNQPGSYYAIDAPEFYTHASGQLVSIQAAPSANPDDLVITYQAPRSAAGGPRGLGRRRPGC